MKIVIFVLVFMNLGGDPVLAAKGKKSELKYQTSFGRCPKKTTGVLTLKLIKAFEKNRSLKGVKKTIIENRLVQRHFLSEYGIDYDPVKKLLKFSFDCPAPLMKVQIYKKNGLNSYEAVLVSNGELYDPTYEVVLRTEQILKESLPFLALPLEGADENRRGEIASLVKGMGQDFGKKLSEIILDEEGRLTIILSLKGVPSSVFLGSDAWERKVGKLKRIVGYLEKREREPLTINLTNADRVIVKFGDNF